MGQDDVLTWLQPHPGWHRTATVARGIGKGYPTIYGSLRALATYNRSPGDTSESLPWLPGKVGRGYPWQTVIIADISRSYMRMIERILISLGV